MWAKYFFDLSMNSLADNWGRVFGYWYSICWLYTIFGNSSWHSFFAIYTTSLSFVSPKLLISSLYYLASPKPMSVTSFPAYLKSLIATSPANRGNVTSETSIIVYNIIVISLSVLNVAWGCFLELMWEPGFWETSWQMCLALSSTLLPERK